MVGGSAYLEAIEGMDGELTKVIEEFVHAVEVEALRFIKRSGKNSLFQSSHETFSIPPYRGARPFAPAA